MSLDARYQIDTPQVIYQLIEGEVVIIRLDTGSYYNLDTIGAEIWEQVSRRETLAGIIDTLTTCYSGERTLIENAILKFIGELEAEKLIRPLPPDAAPSVMPPIPSNDSGARGEKLHFHAPVFEIYTDLQELVLLDPIHEVDEKGWPAKSGAAQ